MPHCTLHIDVSEPVLILIRIELGYWGTITKVLNVLSAKECIEESKALVGSGTLLQTRGACRLHLIVCDHC